jgi:hypothetical protein
VQWSAAIIAATRADKLEALKYLMRQEITREKERENRKREQKELLIFCLVNNLSLCGLLGSFAVRFGVAVARWHIIYRKRT